MNWRENIVVCSQNGRLDLELYVRSAGRVLQIKNFVV